MLGDIPVVPIFALAGFLAIAPALLISIFFGARGVVAAILLIAVVAAGYLLWFATLSDRSNWTGMEGIALVVVPVMVLAAGVCGAFGYALVHVVGLLPHQRRARVTRRDQR